MPNTDFDLEAAQTFLAPAPPIDYFPTLPALLTLKDVSLALDISPMTTKRLTESKQLPSFTAENELLITKPDLIHFIQTHLIANIPLQLD